jgi:hypothetical protein
MNIKNIKTEKHCFWDELAKNEKPVILYGTGDGADKILDSCALRGIQVSGIFASDEFLRGGVPKFFRGFQIKKLSEIREIYGENFRVLLSFATRMDGVISRIYEIDGRHELYIPNFPVFGGKTYFDYDYYLKNRADIERAYDLLADGESRSVYENAVNFSITGRLDYLKPAFMSGSRESALDLLELRGGAHYIDLGAYDGDTVFEILRYSDNTDNIKRISAFEPDVKNFAKLQKNTAEIADICELYNLGAWSHADNLRFNAQGNRNSNFDEPDIGTNYTGEQR